MTDEKVFETRVVVEGKNEFFLEQNSRPNRAPVVSDGRTQTREGEPVLELLVDLQLRHLQRNLRHLRVLKTIIMILYSFILFAMNSLLIMCMLHHHVNYIYGNSSIHTRWNYQESPLYMLLLLLYLFGALALVVEDEGESADIWRNVVEAELLLPDGVGRALHLTPPHFHTPVVLHFNHWVLAALERQLGALYQPDGQLPNFPSSAPALQRPLCPVLAELEQSLRPLPLDVTAFGAQVVNSRQTRDTCYLKGQNTCYSSPWQRALHHLKDELSVEERVVTRVDRGEGQVDDGLRALSLVVLVEVEVILLLIQREEVRLPLLLLLT